MTLPKSKNFYASYYHMILISSSASPAVFVHACRPMALLAAAVFTPSLLFRSMRTMMTQTMTTRTTRSVRERVVSHPPCGLAVRH